MDPAVKGERIQAWGDCPFTWAEVVDVLHKHYPDRTFPDVQTDKRNLLTTDTSLGRELLIKWGGQEGWSSLEKGVLEALEGNI